MSEAHVSATFEAAMSLETHVGIFEGYRRGSRCKWRCVSRVLYRKGMSYLVELAALLTPPIIDALVDAGDNAVVMQRFPATSIQKMTDTAQTQLEGKQNL